MYQYEGGIMKGEDNQIEHKIGKAVADNPDLPHEFVRGVLLATEEVKQGMVKPYIKKNRHAVAT